MVSSNGNLLLTSASLLFTLASFPYVKPLPKSETFPRIKSVCLGGWLVIEGWMTPYLYDTIPNNDMLDGGKINLKSVTTGKFLSAEEGGGTIIVANRRDTADWEKFILWRVNETTFYLRVHDKSSVGLDKYTDVGVVAKAPQPAEAETFQIIRHSKDKMRVRIRASNGYFLQARSDRLVTADYPEESEWKDDDPSVFLMNFVLHEENMRGECQLVNGFSEPKQAEKVMHEHWDTFITEKEFKWIKENGLDAAKIAVGWWIAYDPNPPKPFVAGSLAKLDQAFKWAEKYGIKVIIDLHALRGSQNGWQHSGARDSFQEWGLTDDSIEEAVAIVDFLTARYAKSPMFYAIELINEPANPAVTVETLARYYRRGYEAVRSHSSTAYVIFGLRFVHPYVPRELYPYVSDLYRSVVDTHFYNLFWDFFDNMTVQDNINYIKYDRSSQLGTLLSSDWPLVLVGEWSLDWEVKNSTKEDTHRYAKAQLEVWGRATFGWTYFALKSFGRDSHGHYWNMQKMVDEGYMSLKE